MAEKKFDINLAEDKNHQFDITEFRPYLNSIIHSWSKILLLLGIIFVPLFIVLDYFMMPKELLLRFGIYRFLTTSIMIIQYFSIRATKPGKFSYYQGYLFSVVVGGMIVLMTVNLGGFNSSYYAGLNLVIIAVNILLPWEALHSAINGSLIVAMYIVANAIWGGPFDQPILINNLYFICTTVVVAVCINHVKHQLIKREFFLRAELIEANKYLAQSREELEEARDALWGEMEIAKRIQTSLLPNESKMMGYYRTAALMEPAEEVGGDYYDLIPKKTGELWVTIGDVSGHGVEAGLIMMMTQTSVSSLVRNKRSLKPSAILSAVNFIIKENISRLGSDHYMTISLICLDKPGIMAVAGKHQDIMIYRANEQRIEIIPTEGTWIGIFEDIRKHLSDVLVPINKGDIILLFTDGVTESANKEGELFGEKRLERALIRYSHLELEDILDKIVKEVKEFQEEQNDDITLLLIKKVL
jgi:sigma-B regulation protein RsbU (phosphoserine phosphatase)